MTINRCKNIGNRITTLKVVNQFGRFEDLKDAKIYNVTTNSFLANGGDGYSMIKGKRIFS